MGFFSDLKEDLSQAVNELIPGGNDELEEAVTESTAEEEVSLGIAGFDGESLDDSLTAQQISLDEMLKNIDSIQLPEEVEEEEDASDWKGVEDLSEEVLAELTEDAGTEDSTEENGESEVDLSEMLERMLEEENQKEKKNEQVISFEELTKRAEAYFAASESGEFEEPEESTDDAIAEAITAEEIPEDEIISDEAVLDKEIPVAEEIAEECEEQETGEEIEEETENEESDKELLESEKLPDEEIAGEDDEVTQVEENEPKDDESESVFGESDEGTALTKEDTTANDLGREEAAIPVEKAATEAVAEEIEPLVMEEQTRVEEYKGVEEAMETLENRIAIDETSIITGGMIITGDIFSEGSLEVVGTVNGNIDVYGKLNITGHLNGNSTASEIYAEGAQISGEILSQGAVKIGASTVIIGNITATSAVIAGAVKGDIDVQGPVILDTSAIVMGNIKSKSVQINNGAVIEGMCSQCYADVNPTSFFDDYKPEFKQAK